MKVNPLIFISCFSVIVLFTACGGRSAGYGQVFRYNEFSGIASLDPAFAKNQSVIWAVHQLYNTLVETDNELHIVPSLAYRWDVSADRLTYIFHLRNDVFFHDNESFTDRKGRKMTAYDVEYSFKRIVNPATASSGAWIFTNRIAAPDGFKALDDSTFRLTLSRPFTPVLGLLSMQYCSIVAKEAVEHYGPDFRSHPVGTGPFALKSWEEGQAMIMVKHHALLRERQCRQPPALPRSDQRPVFTTVKQPNS